MFQTSVVYFSETRPYAGLGQLNTHVFCLMQVEEVAGDGAVSKKILTSSSEWKSPNEGSTVCVCVCVCAHACVSAAMPLFDNAACVPFCDDSLAVLPMFASCLLLLFGIGIR